MNVPEPLLRLRGQAMTVGGVAGLALLAGAAMDHHQALRSYLVGFLFWLGVAVGSMTLLMINHQSGGLWGLSVRRLLEASARTLYAAPILFLPIAFGVTDIYGAWAGEAAAGDPIVAAKSAYLNLPFFLARSFGYLIIWALFARFLSVWSQQIDAGAAYEATSRRLRMLAGGGLVVMALTITFAAVDWGMSLNPHWFSTIYGILFMVGWALSALAFTILVLSRLLDEAPFRHVIGRTTLHDLGKLLFGFTMLWAYISVSQLIIVWSGNLPEETPWYVQRLQGGWQYLALALVFLHFVLPFLVLLSRDVKRNRRALGTVASGLLLMRLVDLYWLIGPDLQAHGHGLHPLHPSWMDFAAPLAVGGLWLWLFVGQLAGHALVPVGEPEIRELLPEAGA